MMKFVVWVKHVGSFLHIELSILVFFFKCSGSACLQIYFLNLFCKCITMETWNYKFFVQILNSVWKRTSGSNKNSSLFKTIQDVICFSFLKQIKQIFFLKVGLNPVFPSCETVWTKAEAGQERKMVRWVVPVGKSVDFLQLWLANQWQPAQQLEAPPTRK